MSGIHFPTNKFTLFQNIRFDSVFLFVLRCALPILRWVWIPYGWLPCASRPEVCDAHARRHCVPPSNPVVDQKGLDNAVGIEVVTLYKDAEGKEHIYSVEPMEMVKREGDLYTYKVKFSLSNAGSFKVCYRMFPENVDLPHRQDFCYVRWFI